jgi:lysine 2,3-aminomutase
LSGLAIPAYVVDAPHGGGKIPILPNYVVSMSPTHTVLRNFEGMLVNYPEPLDRQSQNQPQANVKSASPGVWELAAGHTSAITPAGAHRQKRRSSRKGHRPEESDSHPEFSSLLKALMSETGG